MAEYALEVSNVRKSFFGAEVLHGLNFKVEKGEVHGLVGENGAGKSTLMNILGGVFERNDGDLMLDGKPYDPKNPNDAKNAGIGFVHQELSLFTNMTVLENLFIEQFPQTKIKTVDYAYMREKAGKYLKKLGIDASPNTRIEALPMGVRQTVEIAKTLISNANIIIFDEPTTSLSQKEKDNLFKIINELRKENISIIYISHILEDVIMLCDHISVLKDGNIIGTLGRDEYDEAKIIQMMVGREMTNAYPSVEKSIGKTVFQAEHITSGKEVQDVSFEISSGEVVGMYGLMGAGRTELMRAIFGVDKMDSGKVVFKGREIKEVTPRSCIQSGMAFITEDRRAEGLLMPKSVMEKLVLVKADRLVKNKYIIDRKQIETESTQSISELRIKVQDKHEQLARNLSGGNQQKVVIGKWLMMEPEFIIMDEPTRGVDVGAKYEIYSIMLNMAKQGTAVLMVSSEMEELMGVCDRILVMSHGRLVAEIGKQDFDQEKILNYALEGGNRCE